VLYDNGSLVTHSWRGRGRRQRQRFADQPGSEACIGFGHAISAGVRVADNFTVPAGGWSISAITFYAYQTGSSTTTTIDNVNLRIWNGPPGQASSSIVFGDTTTNRLAGSSFSNIYRVLDTGLTDNQRPIMANVVTVNTDAASRQLLARLADRRHAELRALGAARLDPGPDGQAWR
jgi:hypothetical protein